MVAMYKKMAPRQRHLARGASGLGLLGILLIVGCAGDPVEVQVGERTLTRSEVDAYLKDEISRAPVDSQPPAREEFVPRLLRRLQLVEEGRARGLDQGIRIDARRRSEKKAAVLYSMAPDVIDTKVSYSPDEVEAEYRYRNTERRARHVVVKTEAEARAVMAELSGGMSFEDAVRQFSLAGRARDQGGDLGWSARGRMVKAVDELIFSGPVGAKPEIARSQVGFHVVEITGERVLPCRGVVQAAGETTADYERRCASVREGELVELNEAMVAAELSRREQAYLRAVLDQVEVVWNESMVDRITGVAQDEWSKPQALMNFFGADTADVLLEANGEMFSLGWCLSEYAAYDPVRRPKLNTSKTTQNFIRSLVIEDFMYRDGVDRGVDVRPDVAAKTERGVERFIARITRDTLMADVALPTPEDIEAYYLANKEDFHVSERIMIGEITTPHRARIEMADSLLAAGAPFKAIAIKVSTGITARHGGALGPFKQTRRPERWAQADTLEAGQRTPPFEDGDNWSIVEFRKRLPAYDQTLDESLPIIRRRLERVETSKAEMNMQRHLNSAQPVTWNPS